MIDKIDWRDYPGVDDFIGIDLSLIPGIVGSPLNDVVAEHGVRLITIRRNHRLVKNSG